MISADLTAGLLILLVERYGAERERPVSRARFSRNTFLTLSDRRNVRRAFVSEVVDAAAERGWLFFELEDGSFAILEASAADSWTKIASRRIRPELDRVRADDLDARGVDGMISRQREEMDEEA